MRIYVKIMTAATLGVLLLTSLAYSQVRFQSGINFTISLPQNEFKKHLDATGLGGTGYFLVKMPNAPLYAGASLGIVVYGSDTREEPFNEYIPEVIVDVTTRNYILMCHFILRAQPAEGIFRPYLDGLFGFNYIWTETGVYDQQSINYEIASTVNIDDTAVSYGIGGGVMFCVHDRQEHPFATFIDFGIRYLKGGKAEYLQRGSIMHVDGYAVYDVDYSNTDLLTLHMGVSFTF